MNFKQFIQLTIVSTLATWGIFVFLIMTVDPVFADLFELSLVYLTFFIAMVGSILSIAVAVRVTTQPNTILFRHVVISFRQAILLSSLVTGSFLLLSKNLFNGWSMMIFITILSLIEWNAQSLVRKKRSIEHNNDSEKSLS